MSSDITLLLRDRGLEAIFGGRVNLADQEKKLKEGFIIIKLVERHGNEWEYFINCKTKDSPEWSIFAGPYSEYKGRKTIERLLEDPKFIEEEVN